MIFDVEYASGRLRVIRSRLLKEKTLDEIRASSSKESLIAALEGSRYERIFSSRDIDKVDRDLDQDLVSTLERIVSFLPKKYSEDFYKYISRFDLRNLKLAARGLQSGMRIETIMEDLIDYGPIAKQIKENKPSSLYGLMDCIGDRNLKQAYKEGLTNYNESGMLYDLEHSLDKAYMSMLDSIGVKPVRSFADIYRQFIDLRTLSRMDKETANRFLFMPDMRSRTENILAGLKIKDDDIERYISGSMRDQARKHLLSDPFGIGLYIEYMFRKESEVNLLKAVSRRIWR